MLVGISGIDASGKGYVASRLASELDSAGLRVALINVDGWLNLPHLRFLKEEHHRVSPDMGRDCHNSLIKEGDHAKPPSLSKEGWPRVCEAGVVPDVTAQGRHFYHHALRLDEMFERLVLPLKQDRDINLTADFAEETATGFRPHTYAFSDIDIILLEGIFIFKREFVAHFDLKIWIECSFETALTRAITRGQEDLPPDATIEAYQTIYFPAQRKHFEADEPACVADLVFRNDDCGRYE